jgi:hypothetical protein
LLISKAHIRHNQSKYWHTEGSESILLPWAVHIGTRVSHRLTGNSPSLNLSSTQCWGCQSFLLCSGTWVDIIWAMSRLCYVLTFMIRLFSRIIAGPKFRSRWRPPDQEGWNYFVATYVQFSRWRKPSEALVRVKPYGWAQFTSSGSWPCPRKFLWHMLSRLLPPPCPIWPGGPRGRLLVVIILSHCFWLSAQHIQLCFEFLGKKLPPLEINIDRLHCWAGVCL